jgi:ABC-2 type transport system permease protein
MKQVWTIALKDLALLWRDRMSLFFVLGMPIAMGIFFGLIMGNMGSQSAAIKVAVVDEDRSPMSGRFIESLGGAPGLVVEAGERGPALDSVRSGGRTAALIIPAGFGETAGIMWADPPAIQLAIDPSRKAEGGMLEGLIMQAMGELVAQRFQDPASLRPMIDDFQKQLDDQTELSAGTKTLLRGMMSSLDSFLEAADMVQNDPEAAEEGKRGPSLELANIEPLDVTRQVDPNSPAGAVNQLRRRSGHSQWDLSFPQAMLWGVLGCTAGFAISLVRERTRGTLLRLKAAPITSAHVLAGKALACFLAVLAVIAALTGLGFLLGLRPGNWLFLALAAVCLSYCATGVMMTMSVLGRSEEAVGGASWFANILMAMIGGCMIPLAFMPEFLRTLSNLSPVKWGILAIEGAVWREFTLGEMILPCVILLGIGSLGIVLGARILSRARH